MQIQIKKLKQGPNLHVLMMKTSSLLSWPPTPSTEILTAPVLTFVFILCLRAQGPMVMFRKWGQLSEWYFLPAKDFWQKGLWWESRSAYSEWFPWRGASVRCPKILLIRLRIHINPKTFGKRVSYKSRSAYSDGFPWRGASKLLPIRV